jgi:hypothetical protein
MHARLDTARWHQKQVIWSHQHSATGCIRKPLYTLDTGNCSYFKVSARGSTISNEIKSGVVTFLTMSYILLVNPQILGAAGGVMHHTLDNYCNRLVPSFARLQ